MVRLQLTKEKIKPAPENPVKIIGTIQWTLYSAVQPYTNSPMGRSGIPRTMGSNRYLKHLVTFVVFEDILTQA
jgi:hypothetical protein